MRILVLLCLLYFICMNIVAQEVDEQNIYHQALKSHLAYIEKMHAKHPDLWKIADVYYLEENVYTTKKLPGIIKNSKIEVLSQSDIYKKTKKKQSITIMALRPAQWSDGKLVINVVKFFVSREGRHFHYVNAIDDGTSYQIIYNSDTAKYSLVPL